MSDEIPKFVHDTRRVVSVNAACCKLFRCEAVALVDRDPIELIVTEDYKGLARARMKQMREKGDAISPFLYIAQRCDGSKFWVSVTSKDVGDGHFETTCIYIREHTK